jgi:hypothetical protein
LIFNAISARTKSKGFYYSYDPNFKIDLGVYNKLTTVYLYNLDGTFFKEFSSPKECIKYFGHEKTSRLYSAIRTGGLYNGYQVSKEKVAFMKKTKKIGKEKKRHIERYAARGFVCEGALFRQNEAVSVMPPMKFQLLSQFSQYPLLASRSVESKR